MKEKRYNLGVVPAGNPGLSGRSARITWELKEKQGKKIFSMQAEVSNAMYGQCVREVAALFPEDAKAQRMADIWERWHLNDMRPGCEHQRQSFDTSKALELTEYKWSKEFYRMRCKSSEGALSLEEYSEFQAVAARVQAVCTATKRPKYPSAEVQALLAAGWIEAGKTEHKLAGWVTEEEHPEGLLSKPCPVCGYKYGSAWLLEELPPEVVQEIESW